MAGFSRAAWKGFLKFGPVTCGVKLYGSSSESGKIHFRILNRKTRAPVKAAYVDQGTGDIVETADQVKGYELEKGEFLLIDPQEIKALKPVSEHTLSVDGFVPRPEIDSRYLDKSYYVVPADATGRESFALIRAAMLKKNVAARSSIVLYQKGREVVIEPYGEGMLMTTMRNKREVVAEKGVFDGIGKAKTDDDMLEIAGLLIDKKTARFDPTMFEDRYEDALAAMISAKQEGKAPPKKSAPPKENVVNLADILKKSLEKEGIKRAKPATKVAEPRRKSA